MLLWRARGRYWHSLVAGFFSRVTTHDARDPELGVYADAMTDREEPVHLALVLYSGMANSRWPA
jgi:hypothetical protein